MTTLPSYPHGWSAPWLSTPSIRSYSGCWGTDLSVLQSDPLNSSVPWPPTPPPCSALHHPGPLGQGGCRDQGCRLHSPLFTCYPGERVPEPSSWGDAAPALCSVPLYFSCVLGAPLGKSTGHNYSGAASLYAVELIITSAHSDTGEKGHGQGWGAKVWGWLCLS